MGGHAGQQDLWPTRDNGFAARNRRRHCRAIVSKDVDNTYRGQKIALWFFYLITQSGCGAASIICLLPTVVRNQLRPSSGPMVNWNDKLLSASCAVGSIAADYCPAAVNRRPSLQVWYPLCIWCLLLSRQVAFCL